LANPARSVKQAEMRSCVAFSVMRAIIVSDRPPRAPVAGAQRAAEPGRARATVGKTLLVVR
jgi:hypothetical protein